MKDEYELPEWYTPEIIQYLFKIHAKCNIKQYRVLKRCSDRGDVSEWNDWRERNPDEEIFLQGAYLFRFYLPGADFHGANLHGAYLRGSILEDADLYDAYLLKASLQSAYLLGADLQGVSIWNANLQGAILNLGNLQGAKLIVANLRGAILEGANLQGADIFDTDLRGADFSMAIVDGQTNIWTEYIDKDTDFSGIGLDSARLKPGLKQTLQYNIRRKQWEEWYKKGNWPVRFLKRLVIQSFWRVSDYGRSTGRIISIFFLTAFIFAGIYYLCGLVKSPGIIENLFVVESGKVNVPRYIVPLRAIYFSIVTMTTLGFGDIYADPKSIAGHLCLIAQVILGYAFLAALVTRLAILFTADGPAIKHYKKKKIKRKTNKRFVGSKRHAKRRLFRS